MKSTPSTLAHKTCRRIKYRILPFLFILYVIAFILRVNVGYVSLEKTDMLGFTSEIFGIASSIFFVGYILLEIPGCLAVERGRARYWIALMVVSWGVVSIAMGFIQSSGQFYVFRFLLGVAEAGFFPGIIVYLSHWIPSSERAKSVAIFTAAIPVSSIVAAPISGILLDLTWLSMDGWRWLFIIEGVPALILGIVAYFYLTDWPDQAKWLSVEEREWITRELEGERLSVQKKHDGILSVIKDRRIILISTAYFLIATTAYGFVFWLPSFIQKNFDASNFQVGFITILPHALGLIAMLLIGRSSDSRRERHLHTALPMLLAGLGLATSAVLQAMPILSLIMFCVAAIGINCYRPGFWSLPANFLTGTAAAATIGLINSIGNLGGLFGPYMIGHLRESTSSFFGGIFFLSTAAFIAGTLIIFLRKFEQKLARDAFVQP